MIFKMSFSPSAHSLTLESLLVDFLPVRVRPGEVHHRDGLLLPLVPSAGRSHGGVMLFLIASKEQVYRIFLWRLPRGV